MGDLFIEGEVLQFRQLTWRLLEAQQEVVNANAKVRHVQQIKMLASMALITARQAVDVSIERFEQAGAYGALHPFLFHQALRHVGNDKAMVDIRDHLHCQLQAGGRPSSPDPSTSGSPPPDITDILARFDDTPMRDVHAEPFIQDGGDDDGYCE